VVVILTVTYTISFIDRQIMALMIGPIRTDLAITDTQVSLLIGLAFAMFYTLLGLPIARLADRYSRRAINSAGIAIWCVMTAACGMAQTYPQLFLARIGVGVGEAALSPSALSLNLDRKEAAPGCFTSASTPTPVSRRTSTSISRTCETASGS